MIAINETVDGAFIINGDKYIKENVSESLGVISIKEVLWNRICNGLIRKEDRKLFPDSVFYAKDGKLMMQYDEKVKMMWLRSDTIWSVFVDEFKMSSIDVQDFTKDMLEKYFGLEGCRTRQSQQRFNVSVEKYFQEHGEHILIV